MALIGTVPEFVGRIQRAVISTEPNQVSGSYSLGLAVNLTQEEGDLLLGSLMAEIDAAEDAPQ